VVAVAERRCPAGPLPSCRLAGQTHAGAFDDHLALELGEHTQHLHHHAAGGGGGVERLGGRPEGDPGGVQVLQHLGESAGRPGQPVDLEHQQQVVAAGASVMEGLLEAWAVQPLAAHAVAVGASQDPIGLRGDVGRQPLLLGVKGEGLALLVG
jgi:hypothetical protein